MLKGLFSSKETLAHDLGYCKLYDIKYNHMKSTKMYFTASSPIKYDFLRTSKNPNILPIYKITQHSIYTKRVIPFVSVFDEKKKEYNKYVMKKILNAVDYLHNQLKFEHNNIVMDALFVDEFGNVLLGKFDRCKEFESSNDDDYLLQDLCKKILKDTKNSPLKEEHFHSELFEQMEKSANFKNYTIIQKREFMMLILEHKNELIDLIKNNIFNMLIEDIKSMEDKDFKVFMVDSLNRFDPKIFKTFTKSFLSIIDSSVRLYMLQNIKETSNLDDAAEEISLGLRVKDKCLKFETISFIFKNEKSFSSKSFNIFIEAIAQSIDDSESIALVCLKFIETNRSDVHNNMYKLLASFLIHNKSKMMVYKCIEFYFQYFDKYKLSTEMLPMLCSKLSEKEDQDKCFLLVEKILNFLKAHKGEIQSKDWSFKSIKGIFQTKKPDTESKLNERMSRLSKEEEPNEWDDQDF
jgi:hypothetical protein